MSDDELKPCPFCGGEPSEREAGIGTAIRCRKCGSEQFARHRSGAVMLWEARVPPTPAEAVRCPEVMALVEAVMAFDEFDRLPTAAKRPDVFERKVRQPALRALSALEQAVHHE